MGDRRRYAATAAVLYLLVGLWTLRVVLASPATTLPIPALLLPLRTGIAISDQDVVAFQIARNAHNVLAAPAMLLEAGQCYPTPRAVTLGEHMLGEGLLGVPTWALTGDPILTLNAVVLLTYWISAMAAYALVFHWTGSVEAAFVSGLLYGFHPVRIEDPVHPFIVGNQWTVLALLFADRLFRRRRLVDAAGLGLCLSLQLLESFYTVLGMTLIGGIYGLHLAWAHRRTLVATLPQIVLALIPPAIVAWCVYTPYLETRDAWGALQDRSAMLFFPEAYGFGGKAYPGTLLLALAALALLDRLWRRRAQGDESDPRLALALAGLSVVWVSVYFLPLPFTDWSIPSLWNLARGVVPGMDAVRSGGSLCVGVYLSGGLLAGFGVAALCRGRSPAVRGAIALLLAVLWSVETYAQGAATTSFGQRTDLIARDVGLSAETRRLYERIDAGAVADLPVTSEGIAAYLSQASRFIRPHAYHRQPIGSCNDSFLSVVQSQLVAILRLLPRDIGALDALQGLGFRHLVVHLDEVPPEGRAEFAARLQRLQKSRPNHAFLTPAGSDGALSSYRIDGTVPVDSDPAQLEFLAEGASVVAGSAPTLWLQVRNRAPGTVFIHPQPLELTPFSVRWYGPGGTPAGQGIARGFLPLALEPDGRQWLSLPVELPSGTADLEAAISFASQPDETLVRVRPERKAGA